MTSARHSSILKRSMQVFAAFLVLTLIGESVANAYQFPLRVNHRMYRIFVPASSVTKKIVPTKTKAITKKSSTTKAIKIPLAGGATSANSGIDTSTVVTVTATADPSSAEYGLGTTPNLGCSVDKSGYLLSSPSATLLGTDHATPFTISTLSPVGTYWVHCVAPVERGSALVGGRTEDFRVVYQDTSFSILPKRVDITANDKNVFVGDSISSGFSTTSLVGSDAVTSVSFTYAPDAVPTLAKTYSITPSAAVLNNPSNSSNYDFHYNNGTLVISDLSRVIIQPTFSQSNMFYGSSSSISAGYTTSGQANLSQSPTCGIYSDSGHSTPATISSTSSAATYFAHCDGALANSGFSVSYLDDAQFVIKPYEIRVKAADKTITQGGSISNSVTLTPSLLGSDTLNSVTYTYSPSGVPNTVGNYAIIPSSLVLSSGSASNYRFTYVNGSLWINSRPCESNCYPTPPPVDQTPPPVITPVEVIPEPTLPQVAKPIVVVTKPKPAKAPKKRFARSGMQSNRVANFVKFSNVTGKSNLVKIPHDAGTKIQLTDGVAASLKTRLKLEITDEGLLITAVNGWTGRISVPVVVTQNGELVELFIGVVEVPAPVLFPKFYLDDLKSATIKWQPDGSQVVFYNVYLGSKLICTTSNTMCTLVDGLNTHAKLQIEAVGHQQTFSTQVAPAYTNSKLIPASVVHFKVASAALLPYEKSLLDDLVIAAKNLGLNTIYVTGHTDSTGVVSLNKTLSKKRSLAVKKYIAKFFPKVKIVNKGFAATEPVSSNTTASGRTNNRRAEVSVG